MGRASHLVIATWLGVVACGEAIPPSKAPPSVAAAPAPPVASVAPAHAADSAPVAFGDVTVAWVRGMQIIVKHVPGAEFTVGQLSIRGGARNWTSDNAGIEKLALQVAATGGTRDLAKEPFTRKLAALGATIGVKVRNDRSVLSAKSPAGSWDQTFPLLTQVFRLPALPATEVQRVRQQELSALRHELENGEDRLRLVARRVLFAGHTYANRPEGTVETLNAIKVDELGPYLGKLRDTRRLVLVVAGDVDANHVIDQVRTGFADVPQGSYVEIPAQALHFTESHLVGDAFKLPTNYIQSMFAGPVWSTPDFVTMALAMSILRQRVFEEVRSKRNLSYAPDTDFAYNHATPWGMLYVTAVDPTTTMKVMLDEVRRLKTELVGEKELLGFKSVFVSETAQEMETTDDMASWLGRAQLLGGDWRLANGFLDRARGATAEDIRAAARKYITNLQTAIVGDPSKLDPKVVGAE